MESKEQITFQMLAFSFAHQLQEENCKYDILHEYTRVQDIKKVKELPLLSNSNENCGSFCARVKKIANYSPVLPRHIYAKALLSPRVSHDPGNPGRIH